jgi:hypothetical protein
MSDISSFAEWEAQHQHSNKGDILSEREQKLIDMASEHRIWSDRDSSNDYRSSASDSDNMSADGDAIGLPFKEEHGGRTVNGEVKQATGLGTNLRMEIPSSTMEESQALSQKLEEFVSSTTIPEQCNGN